MMIGWKRILLLALVLVFPAVSAFAATITLVADEYCPYNCVPGTERPGFVVEIAREIFGARGYEVEYRVMPWPRAVRAVRRGEYDAVICATPDEAPGLLYSRQEVTLCANDFFVLAGNPWRYTGPASLEGQRLGVIGDYDYSGADHLDVYIREHAGQETVQSLTGGDALERNLRKLVSGRIDVVLDERAVVRCSAARMGIADQVVLAGSEDDTGPMYVAFSPANPATAAYLEIFDEGLEQLRASGRLDEILKPYGLEDWRRPGR